MPLCFLHQMTLPLLRALLYPWMAGERHGEREDYPFRKNSRIEMDAAAPSPTADATCLTLP